MAAKEIKPMDEGELTFHFEKAGQFRVIHVDGAFGGVASGSYLIHMAVYNERQPIPKKMVHSVSGGVLGPEIKDKRQTKDGMFREVEADLVFNLETAIAIRQWLDDKIGEATQVREMAAKVEAAHSVKGDKK